MAIAPASTGSRAEQFVENGREPRERARLQPRRPRATLMGSMVLEGSVAAGLKKPALTRPDESFFSKLPYSSFDARS